MFGDKGELMEYRADFSELSIKEFGDKEPIREITGYASVFGNIDSHGDIIDKGAFANTIEDAKSRKINLYSSHSMDARDLIGSVTHLEEDDHGLYFKASVSSADSAQDLALKAQEGHLDEISIGFFVTDQSFSKNDSGETVRHIKEIDLVEISLVSRASNPKARTLTVKQSTKSNLVKEDNMSEEKKNEEVKAESKNDQMELLMKELAELKSQIRKPVEKTPHVVEVQVKTEETPKMEAKQAFHEFLKGTMSKSEYISTAGLESKALASNVLANGGALVPTELEERILIKRDQINRALNRVSRMEVDGPIDMVDLNFGGTFPAYDENGNVTIDDISNEFGKDRLDAQQFSIIRKISQRLMDRSFANLESLMADRYAVLYANGLEQHIIKGTGQKQPLGITTLLDDLSFNVTNVTANLGTNLAHSTMVDLIMSLEEQYRVNAVILASREAISALMKLTDNQNRPVWLPSAAAGQPATYAGIPIFESPVLDDGDVAGEFPILIGDMSQYMLAEERGFSVEVLRERFADTDQIGLKFKAAYDGMPVDKNAFGIIKTV